MGKGTAFRITFRRSISGIAGLIVILALAFMQVSVSAESKSPFVGSWQAIDVDGSEMILNIGGRPTGPFQITWIDNFISLCNGEPGIVQGSGRLNEGDPNLMEADLHLTCFTNESELDFHLAFRYHPATNTLSVEYENGLVTIWRQHGGPSPAAQALYLRVNYGHDWVESFYAGGHSAWVSLFDSEGNLKSTVALVTEPKPYWGGETGFQSLDSTWFDPEGNPMEYPPDIEPYDWVYAWVDNGASAQVQIGAISGRVGLAGNSIEGAVDATWFTGPVHVECLDWGSGEPVPYANPDGGLITANGSDPYFCSWAEWDIQPGQTVGVGYFGPDGHWVSNAFTAPYPRIVASQAGDWFWVTEFYPGPFNWYLYASAAEGADLIASGQGVVTELQGITSIVPGIDMLSGERLVVSDGVNAKDVVLETITMTVFDTEIDYMAGTAPAGREVWAAAGPQEWQVRILDIADPVTGAWEADFQTIGFNITEDMRTWSFASIYDADGDSNEASTPPPAP